MDLATTLIRSITRSFYGTEHVLAVDAVLRHSAVKDDDLAVLLGMNVKHVRRLCARLREDGLLAVHGQQQQRDGTNRSFTKDFYYVDVHYTIDAIKFKIKHMSKEVERRYGQKVEEKKAYRCPRCEAEYTEMEILDAEIGATGFLCKRCRAGLEDIDQNAGGGSTTHTGSEVQARLNKQLAAFEDLMQRIDAVDVPDNDWPTAFAKMVPVRRDNMTNPGARTTNLDGMQLAKTVKGLKQDMIEEVVIEADLSPAERERREKQRMLEKQKQQENNALPVWHTASTVGAATAGAAGGAANGGDKPADEAEDATAAAATANSATAATDDYFLQMQQEESSEEDESDDDSDDDDDDDDDDEQDDEPSQKKAKTGEAAKPTTAAAAESSDSDE